MSETETKNAATGNGLYAALAKVQADLPSVGKDKTGKIQGKDGKQGYSYSYADLADVTRAIMPLLGKYGLAFTARPTLVDGQFVLAYSLVHESGDREDGFYPLPASGTPQQVGSAITYSRRYSLCAVTGIAPDNDDDDAAAGNQHQQYSRDESWRDTEPVNRQQRQPEQPQDTNPVQWETPPAEPVTDMDWMADLVDTKIPAAMDKKTLDKYWAESVRKHEAGECTAEHGKQIQAFITERARELGLPEKAKAAAQAKADAAANGKTAEPVAS